MADSAASSQSRPQRTASKKRRQSTVSSDTENKLARAARSAQRLAQLSDMSRDGSTLDLFPDDPTRATVEAMNIDVRQGTLHGFELPDVVLAAVGAIDTDGVPPDMKATRRAPRAAKSDEPVPVNGQLIGLETDAREVGASSADAAAFAGAKAAAPVSSENSTDTSTRNTHASLGPAMAAATVARSVTVLRQTVERSDAVVGTITSDETAADKAALAGIAADKTPADKTADTNAETASSAAGMSRMSDAAQHDAATLAKTRNASPAKAPAAIAQTDPQDASPVSAKSAPEAKPADEVTDETAANLATPIPIPAPTAPASTSANPRVSAASAAYTRATFTPAAAARESQRAETAAASQHAATPELDRARATAFADTVDAMYSVISDQRQAATDHSRRMKWMLSIVVGALLVTVAIGITQTVLLMRLTRETTAQQHRIELLMQNQQAAMVNLLDAHTSTANAAVAATAVPASAVPPVAAVADPQQAVTPARATRATRLRHPHKSKAAVAH